MVAHDVLYLAHCSGSNNVLQKYDKEPVQTPTLEQSTLLVFVCRPEESAKLVNHHSKASPPVLQSFNATCQATHIPVSYAVSAWAAFVSIQNQISACKLGLPSWMQPGYYRASLTLSTLFKSRTPVVQRTLSSSLEYCPTLPHCS